MAMINSSKLAATLTPMPAIKKVLYQSLSWSAAPATAVSGAIFSSSFVRLRMQPSTSAQPEQQLRCDSSSSQQSQYLSLPNTMHNSRISVHQYDFLFSDRKIYQFQLRYFARDRGGKRVHYPRSRDAINGKSHSNKNKNKNYEEQLGKYSFGDADSGIIETTNSKKKILVVGSAGILGKTLVSHFGGRNACNWDVVGADVIAVDNDIPTGQYKKELGLSEYICLPRDASTADLTGELFRGVSSYLQLPPGGREKRDKDQLFDAIVCASGGWVGDVDLATYLVEMSNTGALGDVDVEEGFARKNAEICERMMGMNYYPIVAACQIGRRFMKRGGESVDVWMKSIYHSRCSQCYRLYFTNTIAHSYLRVICHHRCFCCIVAHAWNDRVWFGQICCTPPHTVLGADVP